MSRSDAPSDVPMAGNGSDHDVWLSIVGIQETGTEELCDKARQAVSEAEVVFGGSRHLALTATLIHLPGRRH